MSRWRIDPGPRHHRGRPHPRRRRNLSRGLLVVAIVVTGCQPLTTARSKAVVADGVVATAPGPEPDAPPTVAAPATQGTPVQPTEEAVRPPPASADDLTDPGPDATRPLRPVVEDVLRITEDGTIVEGIVLSGCIHVRADDVIIRDTIVRCGGANGIRFFEGTRGGLVERVEIDGLQAASNGLVGGDGVTVRACDIHGANDGIKVGTRSRYVGNHIHDLYQTAESHNDGMQMMSGEAVMIRGNVIASPGGVSALLIKTDRGPIADVRIEGNLLSGGSFTVYVVDAENGFGPPTDVVVSDNVFIDDAAFGSLRTAQGIQASGNHLAGSGAVVVPRVPEG